MEIGPPERKVLFLNGATAIIIDILFTSKTDEKELMKIGIYFWGFAPTLITGSDSLQTQR